MFSLIYISLNWRLRKHLLHKLGVSDPAIFIPIVPITKLMSFSLAGIDAILVENFSKLPLRQVTIAILIDGCESVVNAEVWSSAQALS